MASLYYFFLISGAESLESVSSSHSAGAVAKSFRNLLHTYKIIMNKLGIRVRDLVYKPNSQLLVYVTSVYDEHNFWGQIIEDVRCSIFNQNTILI
jgi:hypothetical protein